MARKQRGEIAIGGRCAERAGESELRAARLKYRSTQPDHFRLFPDPLPLKIQFPSNHQIGASMQLLRGRSYLLFTFASLTLALSGCGSQGSHRKAPRVVQIDVRPLLTGRAVVTLKGDEIVKWDLGIDGKPPGNNGFATESAAKFIGGTYAKALPDNGVFPATEHHPEIVLNYNNNDHVSPQVARIPTNKSLTIPLTPSRFQAFFVHLSSAEGPSPIKITLHYGDGSSDVRITSVNDYGKKLTEQNVDWSYVWEDVAKWGKTMAVREAGNHYITTYSTRPNPEKEMTSVVITAEGGKNLIFLGATGVVN